MRWIMSNLMVQIMEKSNLKKIIIKIINKKIYHREISLWYKLFFKFSKIHNHIQNKRIIFSYI